jgi:hypothetical protein
MNIPAGVRKEKQSKKKRKEKSFIICLYSTDVFL